MLENEIYKPKVKLLGTYGNPFAIMSEVRKVLIKEGLNEAASEFVKEATKGDYSHLLRTVSEYCDIE
ncbi:MAG: hypothetical protein HQK65_16505 [Desulfamplus sp.]|nr:hypothetical protein [Desulfamplus sp.]